MKWKTISSYTSDPHLLQKIIRRNPCLFTCILRGEWPLTDVDGWIDLTQPFGISMPRIYKFCTNTYQYLYPWIPTFEWPQTSFLQRTIQIIISTKCWMLRSIYNKISHWRWRILYSGTQIWRIKFYLKTFKGRMIILISRILW